MVLKNGKGGVCSGNTLRLKSSKYIQQYKRGAFITMNDNSEDFNNDDAKFLNSSDISYSINKKGRWNLPGMIKDELATNLKQLDCKVSLVEVHNIRRMNNCVGYFTNKGRINKVIPKKTKYMNSRSVVNVNNTQRKNRPKRNNRHIKGDNPNSQPVADEIENSVSYEVVYPADTGSSNVYSKPVIAKVKSNARAWIPCNSVSPSKINKSKKRIVDVNEYLFSEEEEDEEYDESMYQGENQVKDTTVFSEYFNQALTKEAHPCSRKRRRNRNAKHDGTNTQKLFYEENSYFTQTMSDNESDDGFLHVDATPTIQKKTTFVPVKVLLPKQDVSDDYLDIRFPGKVHRARCHPRKFCIDIKNDVHERLKQSLVFKKIVIQKLELTSYLIFSYIGNFDGLYDIYDVCINMPSTRNSTKIETIFDMMLTDIDDVFNRSLMFIESCLQPETFIQKEQLNLKTNSCIRFKTIFPDPQPHQWNDEDEPFEWISRDTDEFCNICFESLDESSSTALLECGHWFCNVCWKEHLEQSFNRGKNQMTCPEYMCDKSVDVTTMISLTNIKDIQRMESRAAESSIMASSIKWCPNKLCGKMLQPPNSISNISVCQCGTNVCIDCSKEGHWPASCEQYAFYRQKLDDFKDDVFANAFWIANDVLVKGKHCPKCKRFIVKNGGCPYMTCVCGIAFCWSCLTPQSEHRADRGWCYNRPPSKGTYCQAIKYIPRIDSPEDRTEFYLLALDCREKRHQKHIKILRGLTNKLQSQMLWWVSKKIKSGEALAFSKNTVEHLFVDLVDFILELNFAAEFCFVVLDYEQRESRARFQAVRGIAHGLQSRATEIQDILESGSNENRHKTLSTLQHLKEIGKALLKSLVKIKSKV